MRRVQVGSAILVVISHSMLLAQSAPRDQVKESQRLTWDQVVMNWTKCVATVAKCLTMSLSSISTSLVFGASMPASSALLQEHGMPAPH